MNMLVRALRLAVVLTAIASAAPTLAGQACEEQPMAPAVLSEAMNTAHTLLNKLNDSGSNVVLIGRQGQDLSKYHLKYSHLGIAFRAESSLPWHVYELLNECGTARSELWVDGLANFFLDDLFTFDSIMLVPPPNIAAALAQYLRSPAQLHRLHDPRYSAVAYPFSTKYQNSNQWVLEVVAAAMSSGDIAVRSREQAQGWLKSEHYVPSELKIGAFSRLGARISKANVAFDDHPDSLRFSGRINTVTVDSVVDFLRRRNEGWKIVELTDSR